MAETYSERRRLGMHTHVQTYIHNDDDNCEMSVCNLLLMLYRLNMSHSITNGWGSYTIIIEYLSYVM